MFPIDISFLPQDIYAAWSSPELSREFMDFLSAERPWQPHGRALDWNLIDGYSIYRNLSSMRDEEVKSVLGKSSAFSGNRVGFYYLYGQPVLICARDAALDYFFEMLRDSGEAYFFKIDGEKPHFSSFGEIYAGEFLAFN